MGRRHRRACRGRICKRPARRAVHERTAVQPLREQVLGVEAEVPATSGILGERPARRLLESCVLGGGDPMSDSRRGGTNESSQKLTEYHRDEHRAMQRSLEPRRESGEAEGGQRDQGRHHESDEPRRHAEVRRQLPEQP